jgi:hypothetical protein
MPMRLKLNDDGFAFVSDDGHPVYLMDDEGKEEQDIDVPALYVKMPALTAEATKYRKERNGFRDQLQLFEGVKDIGEWKTSAEAALATVQNLKDKELVDAGKVEQIKSAMKEAHAQELTDVRASYEAKITEQVAALTNKDSKIYGLMVSQKFAQSPWFTGSEHNPSRSLLLPDIAESYFGKNFKVEEGDNGDLVVVGYDNKGNQLYSPKRPGELADFEESLAQVIGAYPAKDSIMRPGKSGSGAGGGSGDGVGPTSELAKMEAAYKTAMESGDGRAAIVLKNRMHDLRMKQVGKT